MSILAKREKNQGIISTIGDVLNAPINLAKDIIKLPFNTIGSITTKFVIVVGLLVVGVYFIAKSDVPKLLSK